MLAADSPAADSPAADSPAADSPALPLYFADGHFVPYCGAKPVMKGWNTKRRHAQKGRADTLVTSYGGRHPRRPGRHHPPPAPPLHQPGHITYTPGAITVTLDPPGTARTSRALAHLIEELNATPPRMAGDPRPITYCLAATS